MATSTVVKTTSQYTDLVKFTSPTVRAITLVVAVNKLKPFTSMNVFFSGANVNQFYVPCSLVQITTTNTFSGREVAQRTDNLSLRTTTTNSYDTLLVGDVITCTSGSAVVIADETIYDPVAVANKRILYVTNIKGAISGQIIGSVSNAIGTVVSVTAGNFNTNSMGNLYGVLKIPAFTFNSGNNTVSVSDSSSADLLSGTTGAHASFATNGIVDHYTTTVNQTSQQVTTVGSAFIPTYNAATTGQLLISDSLANPANFGYIDPGMIGGG